MANLTIHLSEPVTVRFLRHIPIEIKAVFFSLLIGLAVWSVLDHFQSRKLRSIFDAQLDANLQAQATEDRLIFDKYVRSFGNSARLLASQKRMEDYVSSTGWLSAADSVVRRQQLPPWLPRPSVLRSMPSIHFFLLLGPHGRLREIFSSRPDEVLENAVKQPNNLLQRLSHSQTYLSSIGGTPFLITSEGVRNGDNGEIKGLLMLATPIDNDLLQYSQNSLGRNGLVALVKNSTGEIIASSRPLAIPPGALEDDLRKDFLITGKSYFDYGSSDLQMHFISLLPQSRYVSLSKKLLQTDRLNRAITGVALLACIFFLLLFIVRKINKLKTSMDAFAVEKLRAAPHSNLGGDQLYVLEDRFTELKQEILDAQAELQSEEEKNRQLIRERLEMEAHQHLHELLEDVTERLGIGVIVVDKAGGRAANNKMETFAVNFGSLEKFTDPLENSELALVDGQGVEHIFHISKPETMVMEDEIVLVQEITSRRRAEKERERLIEELQVALANVRTLSGFLPICASCKKIRDDQGYWNQLEAYISSHSDALFSHGICPDCIKKLYPDIDLDLSDNDT